MSIATALFGPSAPNDTGTELPAAPGFFASQTRSELASADEKTASRSAYSASHEICTSRIAVEQSKVTVEIAAAYDAIACARDGADVALTSLANEGGVQEAAREIRPLGRLAARRT